MLKTASSAIQSIHCIILGRLDTYCALEYFVILLSRAIIQLTGSPTILSFKNLKQAVKALEIISKKNMLLNCISSFFYNLFYPIKDLKVICSNFEFFVTDV